ncbi:hypothetical protein CXB51_008131 [Gossypium anomalum]|uniref:NAB domain-containing protein n=1 Tax=Gossypium anomalum TaxID=47600 RepID=A0A8J6DA91_9ROSI|nr:hypothetical protein CXB51_008131 [Gossypium anomalum]
MLPNFSSFYQLAFHFDPLRENPPSIFRTELVKKRVGVVVAFEDDICQECTWKDLTGMSYYLFPSQTTTSKGCYPDTQKFRTMEQVEVIKPDVEKRVERILKLIKRKSRKREPELIGHVEEFYRQYQSLSAQYEHLKRESVQKVLKGKGKGNESHPYYSSGSDSEYYSPTDRENDTDTTFDNDRRFHRWMADNIKEELNRAYEEDADLKHQLASKTEESEALASGHLSASSKTEEIETINKDEPKRDSEVGIDGETAETKHQGETNTAMYVPVWEEGDEVTKLMKQLKENEKNLTSRINNSMAQVCNLKKEVDYLRAQQCEARGNVMKPELEVQVKTLKEENQGLQVQVIDLESEVDALCKQKITPKNELSNVHEINQLKEENAHLNSRILGLEALFRERRLEDCQTKREKQTTQMSTEVKLDHVTEKNQVELQIADQQRMMKEIEEHTRKTMESNPKLIKQLSAGNKLNYIERKMGNLAQEFYQKLDDNIRLLCLRIAVAEKTHYENKENYKNIKESLEQENKELKQKLVTCETELTKLIDNAEKKRENDKVLNSEEEQKLKLLKAVSVLEKKVGELEKINKEKDATLLSREEEKREAIRQLCLLIDYHRTNCDYLKELVSQLTESNHLAFYSDENLKGMEGFPKIHVMRKHRFRESMKSFFGHHVDPEKDEQLKGSKIEIDDKVTKILKLIKDEENDSKKEPLVQLIEDFHKHYQSLYEQYDHLTGELRKKVHGKREKDALYSSSSDSDSDFSSKDRNSKNGQLDSEFQKIADGIKQELEEANLEIADLKRKLTATSEEKDALNSDYLASLSKVQEAEETIENLMLESERSESEKSKLLVENEELRHKLDAAAKVEAEVNQRLESAEHQVMELGEGLNATVEENKSLNSKLSEDLEMKGDEISTFVENVRSIEVKLRCQTKNSESRNSY